MFGLKSVVSIHIASSVSPRRAGHPRGDDYRCSSVSRKLVRRWKCVGIGGEGVELVSWGARNAVKRASVVNSRLVCGDYEGENGVMSYEQTLPPWGDSSSGGNEFKMSENGARGDGDEGEDDPSVEGEGEITPKIYLLEERDEAILSKRMLCLSRCNKVRSALELYTSMEASGLRPDPHACNSLLAALLRNGLLDNALRVLEAMRRRGMAEGHSYSLMLKAVASARGCESAISMFEEWENEGEGDLVEVFDAITYNTVISICGRANDWVLAERMWRSLKESGHGATAVTYELLVSAFVRSGQTELTFDAYSEMVQNGLNPSEDMMHAVISACAKDGKSGLAYNVFQNMLKSGFNPSIIAYNALINSLGKGGEVELAFEVFGHMKSSGHKPDAYTWNALLCALNRGGRYADSLQLFESVRRIKTMRLSLHLYNTALLSCQRLGLWNRALQILWQMEASEVDVSTESFNLVISACEAARKPEVALEVYEQMVHRKCAPDTFTYLSLIRACVWGSLWSEVNEILNYVPPDVSLYNAVIHGMCLRGKTSSAKEMYTKMLESGLKPDGKTRSLMIQNLRKMPIRRRNRYPSHRRHH